MLKKILVFSASIIMSLSAYHWTSANAAVLGNKDNSISVVNFSDTIKHKKELEVTVSLIKEQALNTSTKDISEDKDIPQSESTDNNDTYNNNEEEITNVASNEPTYKAVYSMEATAYTGGQYTASGIPPVRDPYGLSTIAVDPSIIPLGSKVYIPGYGEAIAADTGGAINGHIIDLYLNSYDECIQWGRQNVDVYILAYPGEW